MAATVLRVKRRREDNPQDALVLMCKRLKTDCDSEVSPSLFVFRGTVETPETSHVKSVIPKNDIKLKAAANVADIIQKIRKERKDTSAENRYEVINCSRGLKETHDEADEDIFHLVDIQLKESQSEGDSNFAYDLYVAPKQDFDISMLDNLICIENYETDLIFGSYRDNGLANSSDDNESDDSNDENNWRNDYPDSDHSILEEDMIKAAEKVRLEDDLSSDTSEDQIYDEPTDLFNEDVKRYGAAYAKYKVKVLAEQPDLATGLVHSIPVQETATSVPKYKDDMDSYKDDSDDGFYYGQEEDSKHFREQYKYSDSDDNSEPD